MNKFETIFRNPLKAWHLMILKGARVLPYLFSDMVIIKSQFYLNMGYNLDLKNPKTFNEKLQYLKLYDRNPLYTIMVDKVKIKDYAASIIGGEYIIPTIGVWDSPEEIDFHELPNQFVLKCNHNSGIGLYICNNKDKVTPEKWRDIKARLREGLNEDYYLRGREWPYKNIPRKIIAEKFMVDESGYELKDYKFFCFNGICKVLKVDFDRNIDHHANYYDMDWNLLPFGEVICLPMQNRKIEKPYNFDEMIKIVEKLSQNISFCRVDLYYINGKIFFGEVTFYPASGYGEFKPSKYDETLGNMIKLPNKNRKNE